MNDSDDTVSSQVTVNTNLKRENGERKNTASAIYLPTEQEVLDITGVSVVVPKKRQRFSIGYYSTGQQESMQDLEMGETRSDSMSRRQTVESSPPLPIRLRGGGVEGGSSEPQDGDYQPSRKRQRNSSFAEEEEGETAAKAGASAAPAAAASASAAQAAAPQPAKRGRKKRPKEMPRRPLSAYNLFFKHERDRLTGNNTTEQIVALASEIKAPPEGAPPWTLFQALSILIPKRWRALTGNEKIQYEEMAKESMAEYQQKLHLYQIQKARLSLEEYKNHAAAGAQPAAAADSTHQEIEEDQEEEEDESKMPAIAPHHSQNPAAAFPSMLKIGGGGAFAWGAGAGVTTDSSAGGQGGIDGTTGSSSNTNETTTRSGDRNSASDSSDTQRPPPTMDMAALQSFLLAQLNQPQQQHQQRFTTNTSSVPQIQGETTLETLMRMSAAQQHQQSQVGGPQTAAAPAMSSGETNNNTAIAASGLEPEGITALYNLVQALQTAQGSSTPATSQQPIQSHALPTNPAQSIIEELNRALQQNLSPPQPPPPPPPSQPDPALVAVLQSMLELIFQRIQEQELSDDQSVQSQHLQVFIMAFLQALMANAQGSNSSCNIS